MTLPVACTDNIAVLTSKPTFSPYVAPRPPLEELVDNTLSLFEQRQIHMEEEACFKEKSLSRSYLPLRDIKLRVRHAYKMAAQARRDVQGFKNYVRNPPSGWGIAAAWHDPLRARIALHEDWNWRQAHAVYLEFSDKVSKPTIHKLALNAPDFLQSLGALPDEIDYIRANGRQKENRDGYIQSVDLDHVMSLSGAGRWAIDKVPDPERGEGACLFIANTPINIAPTPRDGHNIKSLIVTVQTAPEIFGYDPRWIATPAPLRNLMKNFADAMKHKAEAQEAKRALTASLGSLLDLKKGR
jgi:hypothetical protein